MCDSGPNGVPLERNALLDDVTQPSFFQSTYYKNAKLLDSREWIDYERKLNVRETLLHADLKYPSIIIRERRDTFGVIVLMQLHLFILQIIIW